jgi:hypothetical protein
MDDLKSQNGTPHSNTTDCDLLRDLLPGYAFGICEPEEAHTVERLLPRCPEAAVELADYTAMAQRYLHSAPMVEPPASLLAKLLSLTAEQQHTPVVKSVQRPQPRFPLPYVAFAAAIALLVLLNIGVLTQVMRLSESLHGQTRLLTNFASETILTFQLDVPEAASGSTGSGMTSSSANQNQARAVLHCDPDNRSAIIRAEHFPPADGYQVWLWRDGRRDVGGTLNVDASGTGTVIFEAPEVLGAYQYVSIAPPEGEPPTPVVRGDLYTPSTGTPTPYP